MDPIAPPDRNARRFLRAAREGNVKRLDRLIDQGVPVNSRDRATGATALHYAAAHGARGVLRALLKSDQCDFLIRDKRNRLPSELAGLYGRDPVMARLLLKREVQQARARNLQLHRRADRMAPREQTAREKLTRRRRPDRDNERDRER